MYLIYILADRRVGARSGAQEAPIRTFIENGNLSIPENLVLTSAYPQAPEHPYRLSEQGKKLSTGKGVSDVYVAFLLGAKLTVLGATDGVARVKI